MPNVILTKDDGKVVVAVPSQIVAVLSTVTAPAPGHEDAKSCVFSTFRGFTVYFMNETAREVFATVAGSDDSGREWLELPTFVDDAHYISPDSVSQLEEVELEKFGDALRVWFQRPAAGNNLPVDVYADAAADAALLERLSALIGGGPAEEKPVHNRPAGRAAPRPRARK